MVATLSCSLDPLPYPQRLDTLRALSLLHKCENIKHLKQIHAHLIRTNLTHDQILLTKLISLSSSINYSTLIFNQIQIPTTFTCNIMIRSYTQNSSRRHALLLYSLMLCRRIPPDKFTFPFLIKACMDLNSGKSIHTHTIKTGFSTDIYVQNTLIDHYLKFGDLEYGYQVFDKMRVRNVVSWTTVVAGFVACGKLEVASELFEAMPVRNVVSWTAMIDGYVRNGQSWKAFELFRRMQGEGVRPNEFTLVGLLLACTELGSLSLGRRIHEFARKNGFEMGVFLGTALIDMYSKCGSVKDAVKVFEEMPERSLATWNSMITSLGVHGRGNEAVALFADMDTANVCPDGITFVGILCACVNACLVDEGREFFKIMTERYGVVPSLDHYCCMIELLGRAGMWHDAYELAKNIPGELDVYVWKALLRVCKIHGNVELGEVAYTRVVELDSINDNMPHNPTQQQHHYFEWEVE